MENFLAAPHSAARLPASLLNSFAGGECLAQRSLPARAELFGSLGVRHEEIESLEGGQAWSSVSKPAQPNGLAG
jgi:hypothetical protein